jgi:hypothetical protein
MLPLKCKVKQFTIGPAQSLKKDLHICMPQSFWGQLFAFALLLCVLVIFNFFCGALYGLNCLSVWVIPFSTPFFLIRLEFATVLSRLLYDNLFLSLHLLWLLLFNS